ncbi:MAG: RpiB/LacA/LacB family sugar-phosphate isomerase [Bacteroides sp.]|nr:MAG: RpiB/LacA/LacB family sugar-phosphate isomerase [Bacteroides sp.]
MINIAIGSDHKGFLHKNKIISCITNNNDIFIKDFGTFSENEPVDYPDIVHPIAKNIINNKFNFGVILCGTGNGVAITANKYKHIRAAICWNHDITLLSRKHNNANICCIPAKFIPLEIVASIVCTFIKCNFEYGRHLNRIKKIEI